MYSNVFNRTKIFMISSFIPSKHDSIFNLDEMPESDEDEANTVKTPNFVLLCKI